MFLEHFTTMATYNRWANSRLYDTCARLTDASRKKDRQAFFGSIHGTLNHILVGDRAWLGRIEGIDTEALPLDTVLFEDFDELCSARVNEDERIERVVAGMDPERMAGDLDYRNLAGTGFGTPMRLVLTHLFNHQTHHRGQIHAMLSQTGTQPPELDLIYYVRSR